MNVLIISLWLPLLTYLSFSVFYHIILGVAFFIKDDKQKFDTINRNKFLVLVPAHNEELLIGRLLTSLTGINYDTTQYTTIVVADNCEDNTAEIVTGQNVKILKRVDRLKIGKGFAIEWALGKIELNEFDAVVIIDADNLIDPNFFHGLNEILAEGFHAIQCNNGVANPEETAFTKIMHITRTLDNELYHHAKHKLGLSSFLMGNGMCFTKKLLQKYGWSSSTIAEDYEYYAKLIKKNEVVGFAANSKLYHQESKGLRHASSQRLRWSSGRFQVARKYGFDILKKGLKERNYIIVDASFPLILPNLSLMVNMTIAALIVAIMTHFLYPVSWLVSWIIILALLEVVYFFGGVYLVKMSNWKLFLTLGFAPIFLLWKGFIDVKGLFGKKIEKWGRSKRQ